MCGITAGEFQAQAGGREKLGGILIYFTTQEKIWKNKNKVKIKKKVMTKNGTDKN